MVYMITLGIRGYFSRTVPLSTQINRAKEGVALAAPIACLANQLEENGARQPVPNNETETETSTHRPKKTRCRQTTWIWRQFTPLPKKRKRKATSSLCLQQHPPNYP
jgi:hypothetical protein